jgi:hypothetical protein
MTESAKQPPPEKFDWVTELSRCSIGSVFEQLKIQVEYDVNIRTALRPDKCPYGFTMVAHESTFSVVFKQQNIYRAVSFVMRDDLIVVRDHNNEEMLQASLTINDKGECRLKVKGEERELWQFRRMALEDLFFRPLPSPLQ